MNKTLLILAIAFGLTQLAIGQITCLPCDQLGMSINVGSDTNSVSIYHSGHYLTHPQEQNTFVWEILDMQGNIISQDTIEDNAFYNFSLGIPITDTFDVIVYLTNDSAILPNGNPINCFFEDQVYWQTGVFPSGTEWGSWQFVHNNVGIDQNTQTGIDNFIFENKRLLRIVDITGKECQKLLNKPVLYIYDDGSVEKKMILE